MALRRLRSRGSSWTRRREAAHGCGHVPPGPAGPAQRHARDTRCARSLREVRLRAAGRASALDGDPPPVSRLERAQRRADERLQSLFSELIRDLRPANLAVTNDPFAEPAKRRQNADKVPERHRMKRAAAGLVARAQSI